VGQRAPKTKTASPPEAAHGRIEIRALKFWKGKRKEDDACLVEGSNNFQFGGSAITDPEKGR